jgi:enoyl-CoA hydratase/carnithine racemase
LRSEGTLFCAGADLALMRACFETPEGPDTMMVVVRRMQALFSRLDSAPVVSIAEMPGAALGGGFELALACDLRIAALEAKVGLPEARLGLLPGAGGTQRLTRLCGRAVATRLILGAEVLDGAAAERLGLVHWAVPRTELAQFAAGVAERFAKVPRTTVAANKRCIALAGQPGEAGFAEELAGTRRLYDEPEIRRRVGAFLDKAA